MTVLARFLGCGVISGGLVYDAGLMANEPAYPCDETCIDAAAPAVPRCSLSVGGESIHRYVRLLLGLGSWYFLGVAILLALVGEVVRWGWVVSPGVRLEIDGAIRLHACTAGAAAVCYAAARFRGRCARGARSSSAGIARLLLALVPIGLLGSVDQLVGIGFPRIMPPTGMTIPHPRRGWSNRPGWRGMDGASEVRINRLGLRGAELPETKEPHERRILVLGDSVTFGSQVSEEALFTSRLERAWTEERPGTEPGGAVEGIRAVRSVVVNASAPAYAPWQEHDLLLHVGFATHPNAVLYVFCVNDVVEPFQLERFGGYWRGFEPPTPEPLEASGLYRAARAWKAWRSRPSNEQLWDLRGRYSPSYLLEHPDSDVARRGWEMVFEALRKIAAACGERSIPFAMVAAPHGQQLTEGSYPLPTPQSVLRAFAAEHHIPCLDLLPAFRAFQSERSGSAESLFIDPLHLSALGHELAAKEIAGFAAGLGWFD